MRCMFLLTLVPHETSPPLPLGLLTERLPKLLSGMGTLHEFALLSEGGKSIFRVSLCSSLSKAELEHSFRGMMVFPEVEQQQENGACHDCQTKMVA